MSAPDWSGRTAFVTGGAGFIGSHLVERLAGLGARVRVLVRYSAGRSRGWLEGSPVRDDVDIVLGDVRDPDSFRHALGGVDAVFHLAALIGIPYSYRAATSYVRTNVEGTLNVLQESLRAGVRRVVHTSTSEVYGSARYVPMDEAHPLQGQSPYSATKIGADKLAESFHRSFDLPVVTVRPFNTYGPRQSDRAVIPTIISQALAGGRVGLGDLTPRRDFVYVEDTAEGFVRAAAADAAVGEVVNLATGREVAIADVVHAVEGILGRGLQVQREAERVRPEGSEVDRLCGDAARARELLGWEPRHTLEDGLRSTIDWIREHPGGYRVGTYGV